MAKQFRELPVLDTHMLLNKLGRHVFLPLEDGIQDLGMFHKGFFHPVCRSELKPAIRMQAAMQCGGLFR